MQTKAKANSVITHLPIMDNGELVGVIFRVKGAGDLTFNFRKVHTDLRLTAEGHGWIQRISDAAAISRDAETGTAATPAEKLAAMERLVEHYESGTAEWSRVAEAGPRGGILFKALCRMFAGQKSAEEVRTWLDARTKVEQAALRASEKVRKIIAEIEAEAVTAAPKVDTEALLANLTQ